MKLEKKEKEDLVLLINRIKKMKVITINPQDRDDYYVDWLEESTGYLLLSEEEHNALFIS